MTLQQAIQQARERSTQEHCTVHVQVRCVYLPPNPAERFDRCIIVPNGYTVSDWHDGSTIVTFTNGERI